MNIALWILLALLAIHTLMGAIWKFSNSEQTVAPLSSIPHRVWMGLSVLEIIAVIFLVLPVISKRFGRLVPAAAFAIAAEMIYFSIVFLASGATDFNQLIYWLVVAMVCIFVAYGRLRLKPIH